MSGIFNNEGDIEENSYIANQPPNGSDEEDNRNNSRELTASKVRLSFDQEKRIQQLPSFALKKGPVIKQSEYKPLVLRNIPLFFWGIGLIFLIFAILLTANMIIGDNEEKRIFKGFYGKYKFEYFVLVLIYGFGISFFVTARYEKIVIDKQKNEMSISKFFILKCKKEFLNIPVSDVNAVFPTRMVTYHTDMQKTCLTKIGIRFRETSTVYVFKTIFKYFLIKNVIKMRAYLFKKISTYESVNEELKGTETHMEIVH